MENTILSSDLAVELKKEMKETSTDAMRIADVLTEADLLQYFSQGESHLSDEMLLRIQKTDKETLAQLIKKNIVGRRKKNHIPKTLRETGDSDITYQLEDSTKKAMKKIGSDKETDLCFYILYEGKRIHHFTYEKMKATEPQKLNDLIRDYILLKEPEKYDRPNHNKNKDSLELTIEKVPQHQLVPKQAPQQDVPSEKEASKIDQLLEKTSESIEMMYQLLQAIRNQNPNDGEEVVKKALKDTTCSAAELKQDKKAAQRETAHDRYFKTIQNQLIKQIRKRGVDHELWDTFADFIEGGQEDV